ncbi:hypothetical protein [Rugosimonospora africana]|uniref:Uncharacterized protein n=1 Tax=Rugosimonospora africana TaxID=556532 RepID=A0A8J3QW11_9ACTN|nr:hypothetical protein [Rugosimonospora africana]GIH16838.1 hypothetical protein Raf01_50100 [Rugosimonospora africana]
MTEPSPNQPLQPPWGEAAGEPDYACHERYEQAELIGGTADGAEVEVRCDAEWWVILPNLEPLADHGGDLERHWPPQVYCRVGRRDDGVARFELAGLAYHDG